MAWVRGKCLGKGAFGTVHAAVDRETGRVFAVKSVEVESLSSPAAAVACLEREIEILKQLSSPYVVGYLGDDTTAACRNLHMELAPGGSVAEAAARSGGVGERAARAVLRRVAEALHYLHAVAGVVHGDVKGRNVLACAGGAAKLADFGAARLLSEAAGGGPRGTPAWMAPEVARGGAPTPASDVWSLGCTAVELLTGKQPWHEVTAGCGGEVAGLLLLVGFGGKRPEPPVWLSDSGKDFLDKCLRRDPGERWSCEQLLRHPFLQAAAGEAAAPSPRAVLDWAVSDSESESLEDPEADTKPEVISRAKSRIGELASNGPDMGWAWEADDAWATVMWAHKPTSDPPAHGTLMLVRVEAEDDNASGSLISDGVPEIDTRCPLGSRSDGFYSCCVYCYFYCISSCDYKHECVLDCWSWTLVAATIWIPLLIQSKSVFIRFNTLLRMLIWYAQVKCVAVLFNCGTIRCDYELPLVCGVCMQRIAIGRLPDA